MVEQQLSYGGGLATEEVTPARLLPQPALDQSFPHRQVAVVQGPRPRQPGSLHHAALRIGQAHRDGTALVLGRDLEETIADVTFSQRDAATFGRIWNRSAEPSPRRSCCPSGSRSRCRRRARRPAARNGSFLAATRRQPLDLVEELFENERVRLLMLFKISLLERDMADRHAVEDEPDELRHPRLTCRPATSSARAARSIWRAA